MVFKEPIHLILERIKHESYFYWPGKMGGTQLREIRVYIARTTVIKGITHSNVGFLEITWNNWLKSDT